MGVESEGQHCGLCRDSTDLSTVALNGRAPSGRVGRSVKAARISGQPAAPAQQRKVPGMDTDEWRSLLYRHARFEFITVRSTLISDHVLVSCVRTLTCCSSSWMLGIDQWEIRKW
jgi:hypothetical protein